MATSIQCIREYEKGSAIFFAVIVMGVVLNVALGMSAILLSRNRTLGETNDSLFALGAADTGTERVLYIDKAVCEGVLNSDQAGTFGCILTEVNNLNLIGPQEVQNNADHTYTLGVVEGVDLGGGPPECSGNTYCATSEGFYQQSINQQASRQAQAAH